MSRPGPGQPLAPGGGPPDSAPTYAASLAAVATVTPVTSAPVSAALLDQEASFITGVGATGILTGSNFWTWNGADPAGYGPSYGSAHKWAGGAAGGSGGLVTYYSDPSAHWSASEEAAFQAGLALWSAEANIRFVRVTSAAQADATFTRGADQSAYETGPTTYDPPGSRNIGSSLPGTRISIDTSVPGWQQLDSFTASGGYGIGTVVHEEGHLLGLGHAGSYNGSLQPSRQQFGPLDTRLWSIMSYIEPNDGTAKYAAQYPVGGASWSSIASSVTPMPIDILAAQRLYGVPVTTPLSGGQIFGFHTNITGAIAPFFDFSINVNPVVTLWDAGSGNTLDVSGFAQPSTVNLNPGTFSSTDGMADNIGIAFNTRIDSAVGGAGNDRFILNAESDAINGGGGGNTAVFALSRASYSLSTHAGVVTALDLADGARDTLTNIGTLQFADTVVATNGLVPPSIAADCNGDGTSDLLLQNADGTPSVWLLNGGAVLQHGTLANPGAGWHAVAAADFNGDGKSDILFQNIDASLAVWEMNGAGVLATGGIGNPGAGWSAVAAGDFNGDGRADILLQNIAGTAAIWTTDGLTVTARATIGGPGTGWRAVATGDFNGDGHADILWQNAAGNDAVWEMNGSGPLAEATIGAEGPGWSAVATGDFNADGHADIVWQSTAGSAAIWAMNATAVLSKTVIGGMGAGWHVAAAGDYNGDGHTDIMWQGPDGTPEIWEMNGVTVTGRVALTSPGTAWRIIGASSGSTAASTAITPSTLAAPCQPQHRDHAESQAFTRRADRRRGCKTPRRACPPYRTSGRGDRLRRGHGAVSGARPYRHHRHQRGNADPAASNLAATRLWLTAGAGLCRLHPAPAGDRQGIDPDHVLHHGQADAFVDPMDGIAIGAVAGRLRSLVERVEARIREPGRVVRPQRLAGHLAMQRGHGARDRLVRREDGAIRHEALEFQRELCAAQRLVALGFGHQPLDIRPHRADRISRHHADAHADARPRRHRAVPLAAFDGAEIDVDRMIVGGEGGMAALGTVHLGLVVAEMPGERIGRLDRVHPRMHLAYMGGPAGHRHPGPHHADLGNIERGMAGTGLRDQAGLRRVERLHHRERAVAGAFLLDHRRHLQLRRGLQPGEAQRPEGGDIRRDTGLHVRRAAAIHPPVTDARLERRRGPEIGRALRHHIDMPLQHQAAPAARTGVMHRHDVFAPAIWYQRRREAGMIGERGGIDGHPSRRQADLAIHRLHFCQTPGFLAEHAPMADQPDEQRNRIVAQGVHGAQDGAPRAGIDRQEIAHRRRLTRAARCSQPGLPAGVAGQSSRRNVTTSTSRWAGSTGSIGSTGVTP